MGDEITEELDGIEGHLGGGLSVVEDEAGAIFSGGFTAIARERSGVLESTAGLPTRRAITTRWDEHSRKEERTASVVYISASLPCTSWKVAIGLPNCFLSWV